MTKSILNCKKSGVCEQKHKQICNTVCTGQSVCCMYCTEDTDQYQEKAEATQQSLQGH